MILVSELTLDAVLLRIVEIAADLTDARYGALARHTTTPGSVE